MDPNKSFDKFQNDYNAFGKLIKENSSVGSRVINNIISKKDYFNSLSNSERIQFMNTDPDFIALKKIMKNLKIYYASIFDFVNKSFDDTEMK